ncbi:hypothetical protein XENTR_v10002010, partial [Xenopus tropicalis]
RSYGQSVIQPETHHFVLQGEAVHLNCTYKTAGASYRYWYVRYLDKALEMLLYNFGEQMNNGFTIFKENTDSIFNIYKKAAELSDSGVYFCAVSDTVTYSVLVPVT